MRFNSIGFLMFVAAFGGAYGIMVSLGSEREGLWMMIAGPLLAGIDLVARSLRRAPLFGRVGASQILFLPAWCWGAFWTVLGAVYYARGG